MNPIKEMATIAALSLALSGQALAQGSLGNSGASSAVQSAPSALDASKGAVESTPSSGSDFGSSTTGSAGSSVTTPDGRPIREGGASQNSGRTAPAAPNSR